MESRPAELPRQPLAERYVNLSIHTAPIGQVNFILVNQFDRQLAAMQDNLPKLIPYESNPVFTTNSSDLSGCWLHHKQASRQDPNNFVDPY